MQWRTRPMGRKLNELPSFDAPRVLPRLATPQVLAGPRQSGVPAGRHPRSGSYY